MTTTSQIVAAADSISARGRAVNLSSLRRKLRGSRAEVDQALWRASDEGAIALMRNDFRPTREDESAALDLGGGAKRHLLYVRSSHVPLATTQSNPRGRPSDNKKEASPMATRKKAAKKTAKKTCKKACKKTTTRKKVAKKTRKKAPARGTSRARTQAPLRPIRKKAKKKAKKKATPRVGTLKKFPDGSVWEYKGSRGWVAVSGEGGAAPSVSMKTLISRTKKDLEKARKKVSKKKASKKKATKKTVKKAAKKKATKKTVRKVTKKTARKTAPKGERTVTAADVIGGTAARKKGGPAVWICAGPTRTGCGGGKKGRKGSKVVGIINPGNSRGGLF